MDEIRGAGHLYLPKEELRTQAYNLLNEGFPHEAVTLQAISAELYVMVVTKHLLAPIREHLSAQKPSGGGVHGQKDCTIAAAAR